MAVGNRLVKLALSSSIEVALVDVKVALPGGFPTDNSTLHSTFEATLGRSLTQAQRDEWVGRITRQPEHYTLQAYAPLLQDQLAAGASVAQALNALAERSASLRAVRTEVGATCTWPRVQLQLWQYLVLPNSVMRKALPPALLAACWQARYQAVVGTPNLDL